VVILGGLFTSTLLNLLVLPVLYERFGNVPLPPDEETETRSETISEPARTVHADGLPV